ncbi:hypothetical protein FRB90_012159 [Tulasnella sp. 427]|nr:hypothetical protein FRB90_012159 [Tulasnella sp. 427]
MTREFDLVEMAICLFGDAHDTHAGKVPMHLLAQAIATAPSADDIYKITALAYPNDVPDRIISTPETSVRMAREKWNSMLPVQSLPPELLVETVRLALPEPTFDKPTGAISNPELLPALIGFSSVCRRWRDIINGAASLWAFLSADGTSASLLQLVLERSQSAPLVITTGNLRMNTAQFLSIATPQVYHSRSLCVMPFVSERVGARREDSEHDAMYGLLQQPSPVLEELHINGRRGSWSEGQFVLREFKVWALENVAVNLRVLRVERMHWCWTPDLSRLQELKLSRIGISPFDFILKCLGNATNLRVLDLEALHLIQAGHQDPPLRLEPVNLKFLQALTLSTMKTDNIARSLQCITTPSLRKLILSTTYVTAGAESLFATGTPSTCYHDLFRSIVTARKEQVPLYVFDESFRLAISNLDDGSEVTIEGLALTEWEATNLVKWLAAIWNPLSSVASICLILEKVNISQERIAPFTHIKNISSIRILEEVEDVHYLYDLLLRPAPLEGGGNDWLFPRLATLQVVGSLEAVEVPWLVHVLGARWEANQKAIPSGSAKPEPPEIVELLRIRSGVHSTHDFPTLDRLRREDGPQALADLLC